MPEGDKTPTETAAPRRPVRYVLGAAGPQYPAPSAGFDVASAYLGMTPLATLIPLRADIYLLQGLHLSDAEELRRCLRTEWQVLTHFANGGVGSGGDGIAVAVRAAHWRVEASTMARIGDLLNDSERAEEHSNGTCSNVVGEPCCGAIIVTLRHRVTGMALIAASARLAVWHSDLRPAQAVQALMVLRTASEAAEKAGAASVVLGGDWNAPEGSAAQRLLCGDEIDIEDDQHPGQQGWEVFADPLQAPKLCDPRSAPGPPPAVGPATPLLLAHLHASPLTAPRMAQRCECGFPPSDKDAS